MKAKVIGVLACVVMLLSVAGIFLWEQDDGNTSRVHQHKLPAPAKSDCTCDKSELCTHLPLVLIDTNGQTIPGISTGERDSFGESIPTVADDGRATVDVSVSVIDRQKACNHPSDTPTLSTTAQIRVRGHSSRSFAKKSYALNFVDDAGENRDLPVMGMDAHHEWVLNGPSLDKSLLRNYLFYNLAGTLMHYAPNVRFCELIVDGDYRGLYLMLESVTNGNTPDPSQSGKRSSTSRLNLRGTVKGEEFTGYLLNVDRPREDTHYLDKNIDTYTERMLYYPENISIAYPGETRLTAETAASIEAEFSAFEKSLYSYDYDTKDYGYQNYIDVANFVDYYLINELAGNWDAGRYSTYLYKELGEKYRLCVWDFNNACDNYVEDVSTPDQLDMQGGLWYSMLFRDEDFVADVITRYRELRKTYFSEEYLNQYIDDTIAYLGDAIARNNERWKEPLTRWQPLQPIERNVYSHKTAVLQLKTWLHERGEFFDAHIDSLQQYSHPSMNKRYNH